MFEIQFGVWLNNRAGVLKVSSVWLWAQSSLVTHLYLIISKSPQIFLQNYLISDIFLVSANALDHIKFCVKSVSLVRLWITILDIRNTHYIHFPSGQFLMFFELSGCQAKGWHHHKLDISNLVTSSFNFSSWFVTIFCKPSVFLN